MSDPTLITRVVLKNYKSIARCDVRLRPLMFLVGPNGSGKSNFLDALRFVSDALNTSLDHALRDRGGIPGGPPSLRRPSQPLQHIPGIPASRRNCGAIRVPHRRASLRGGMRSNRKSAA